jgi:glutathione-regulated potassium-efflux system ancillary protein KefG
MNNILILFAHPRLEKSRVNTALIRAIPPSPAITFHDLYEEYPDFAIDVPREKKLLTDHEIVVWHHPFFWYSSPPLLKQWIDLVLEVGWAYGPGGTALKGKTAFNVLTSGGARDAYSHEGRNRFTIREFLAPFEQTARLCSMTYLPPFMVQGTHRLTEGAIADHARVYGLLLQGLADGTLRTPDLQHLDKLNDAVSTTRNEVTR